MKKDWDIVIASHHHPRIPHSTFAKTGTVRNTTWSRLLKKHEWSPITIVEASPGDLPNYRGIARTLAQKTGQSLQPRFVVFAFEQPAGIKMAVKVELLKPFPHPERVDISESDDALPRLVENLALKVELLQEHHAPARLTSPRPSPLDDTKAVLDATSDLRLDNGNLSAERVSTLFGISLSKLAAWLKRTKQALSKTPDADSLQPSLGYFERIARLRLITENDAEFRKWLRRPNPNLRRRAPLELIAAGQWQALADKVDDMLTGAPA